MLRIDSRVGELDNAVARLVVLPSLKCVAERGEGVRANAINRITQRNQLLVSGFQKQAVEPMQQRADCAGRQQSLSLVGQRDTEEAFIVIESIIGEFSIEVLDQRVHQLA